MSKTRSWEVECDSCGGKYTVQAKDEKTAIKKAEQDHEERNNKATQWRCDYGPSMSHAHNLDYDW